MQSLVKSKSNIGKMPVVIPEGTVVFSTGKKLLFKGKLGVCSLKIPEFLNVQVKESSLYICPSRTLKSSDSMLWGTYRALVNCSVIGVTFGFRHQLELLGLGYKLAVINGMVVFKVGASHEIFYKIPAACLLKVITPTRLLVKSIDASRAGSITSSIYELRKPDAYKGKGIRWDVKSLFLKEGKKQK